MATTVAALLLSSRNRLSDEDSQRWSDARLLEALNQGIQQLMVDTQLVLESYLYVELLAGQQTYNITDKALKITRIEFDDERMAMITHSNMDNIDKDWPSENGDTIQYIVYDKALRGEFKVYPIPLFENTNAVISSFNGMITGVFGGEVIETVTSTGLADSAVLTEYLKVYYIDKPADLLLTDTLPLDEIWDTCLKHYIAAEAFRDNFDGQSRQLSGEELQLYSAKVRQLTRLRDKDFANINKRKTSYRGAF